MYENTMFKAFVAETAAKVAASISTAFVEHREVSLLKSESRCYEIAEASICVAEKLADELEGWWMQKGDMKTTMFDPADTKYSDIVRWLSDISEKLDGVRRELMIVGNHMVRE